MRVKDCPSCGLTVPNSASRCKSCWHDFTEAPPRRSLKGPLIFLGAVAGMAIVGAGTFWWIASAPIDEKILVDGESQSVVWTRKFRNSVETDRLPFADVVKLQYVVRGNGGFEVVAITTHGERVVIREDVSPIKSTAEQYAKLMEKPLEEVDNTRGFHKVD